MHLSIKTHPISLMTTEILIKLAFCRNTQNFEISYLSDESTDLNAKFDISLLNLNDLIEKHCLEKKLNKKMLKLRNKPWINFQIQ